MQPLLYGKFEITTTPFYSQLSFLISTSDEHLKSKRERHQADEKWRKTKQFVFNELHRQADHKVSMLVHTCKCQFYTEITALSPSSIELHQIVNTLSNRHPTKILPTNYSSADLQNLFTRHIDNKAKKRRANIASEPATSTSLLDSGTNSLTVDCDNFSPFEMKNFFS